MYDVFFSGIITRNYYIFEYQQRAKGKQDNYKIRKLEYKTYSFFAESWLHNVRFDEAGGPDHIRAVRSKR